MVAWPTGHAELLGGLLVVGLSVLVALVVVVLFRHTRHRLRDRTVFERATEERTTESPVGALTPIGLLPTDDPIEHLHGDGYGSERPVLGIDAAEPTIRCPACEGSTLAGEVFCWRCGEWLDGTRTDG